MKALVYHGPGRKAWEDVPDATIKDDTDAVVRVDTVTICGTDLHILKGDMPEVIDGRILGHEAVGTVESVGSGVKTVKEGDRVLVSCVSACGHCRFCREGRFGQCLGGGGWILGHMIDGTQAEYVRMPFADTSTYQVPAGVTDEEILMLADILPTGYEVGVLNGAGAARRHRRDRGRGADRPVGDHGRPAVHAPPHVAIDLADARLEAAKSVRRRPDGEQRPRGRAAVRHGADRRGPRRGRRDRGGRRAGHIRARARDLFVPVATSRTSGCTASPRRSTSSSSGSATSRSRPVWSTRTRRRRCFVWSAVTSSTQVGSSRTGSPRPV